MIAIAVLLAAMQTDPAASIDGLWKNPAGTVIVEVAPCGEARCGTVRWATRKAIADAAKGTPQLIGTQLFTDLRQKTPGRWQGRLFVPDANVRTRAKIQPSGTDQLKVSGCTLAGAICKSQVWTRTAEPFPASN